MLTAGGLLAACGGSSSGGAGASSSAASSPPSSGALKAGGSLSVGATGGGAKDTIDAHLPTADTDIMRCWNLYEPLAVRPPSFGPLEMMVAESIEAEHGKADSWIVKLRPGIEFHNGKTVSADDVIFSLQRILDAKAPKVGAASIATSTQEHQEALELDVRLPLKFANAAFLDDIGQYFNAIVPVGYDPAKPVGTGAFMYESFSPGQQSVFRNPNYWQHGKPYVDTLTIIDFTDDTARVNALLGGQVQAIDNLPTGQIGVQVELGAEGAHLAHRRVAAVHDARRPASVLRRPRPPGDAPDRRPPADGRAGTVGAGRVANDMYSPFDPPMTTLPQRQQDIEQAKSLLKRPATPG